MMNCKGCICKRCMFKRMVCVFKPCKLCKENEASHIVTQCVDYVSWYMFGIVAIEVMAIIWFI
jgi:hypothetical protein